MTKRARDRVIATEVMSMLGRIEGSCTRRFREGGMLRYCSRLGLHKKVSREIGDKGDDCTRTRTGTVG